MPIFKNLVDRIQTRKDKDGKLPKLRDIFTPLWDVISDGDVDADDFDDVVESFRRLIAYAVPLIDVPWVPEIIESRVLDPRVISLLQYFAPEIVSFVFSRFNIPLPE